MNQIRQWVTRAIWGLGSLLFTLVLIVSVTYAYMSLQLPNVDALKDIRMQVPLKVYTADGQLIAQFGDMRRTPVTLDQIPKPLINAVLATEDARFYDHPGVDVIGLFRAAAAVISSGRKVQGASTITMQVARNFFLSREKTYSRKIKEILLALKINQTLSKDKILELYLNRIYFGNRAYGVAEAAEVYYGKKLDQLTLAEMATLAGLPQAPSANNPLTDPDAAIKRRNHVLERMLEQNYITKKQYNEAILAPNTAQYHREVNQVNAPFVAEMVREAMFEEYGAQAYEAGLNVYTTIRAPVQRISNEALQNGLIAYDHRHGYRKPSVNLGTFDRARWIQALQNQPIIANLIPAAVTAVGDQTVTALLGNGQTITINWNGLKWARPALSDGYVGSSPRTAHDVASVGDLIRVQNLGTGTWQLSQLPQVQGAMVVLNPNDGAILALNGGFSYDTSNFNRAIQAERQPGSNFKPFIYSAALAKGFTLASVINDAPIVEREVGGEDEFWRPQNDEQKFYGPTTLRTALVMSRNLVSIRLLRAIGIPYALNYISRFGFDPHALPNTLSLALGSGTVTPLQIAAGYSVIANGGYRVTPYFIQKIVDQTGKVLFTAQPQQACTACISNPQLPANQQPQPTAPLVIPSQDAYLMTQVLRDVIQHGTGEAAKSLNRKDIAGKTGTTNSEVDAWFSGFNSNVMTTVWVGFDNLRPLQEKGAQAALPIWIDFMRQALAGTPEVTMPEPPGIVNARINPATGTLADPNDPHARFELFRQPFVPTLTSSGAAVDNSAPATPAPGTPPATHGSSPATTPPTAPAGGSDNMTEEQLF